MTAFNPVVLVWPDVVNFLFWMLCVIALAIWWGMKE
jgi:hypothetical protein